MTPSVIPGDFSSYLVPAVTTIFLFFTFFGILPKKSRPVSFLQASVLTIGTIATISLLSSWSSQESFAQGISPNAFFSTPNQSSDVFLDYLTDYFDNRTYPTIADAKPWINTSVNWTQYNEPLGGITFWDFFASNFHEHSEEPWDSTDYGWQDYQGKWQQYAQESIRDQTGKSVPSYVIVDRDGPGVVDKMIFTEYSQGVRPWESPADLVEWGYLGHLGKLRIQVDGRVEYDGAILDWFSGKALCLPEDLSSLFLWRHRDYGSNGSIIPIPYQKHIKISVYGGTEKPRWFTITGMTLTEQPRGKFTAGCVDTSTQSKLGRMSANVFKPEAYLGSLNQREIILDVQQKSNPSGKLEFQGYGTIQAIQFRVPKKYDVGAIDFQVTYGNQVGIHLPLMAFFGDQDRVAKHRSVPVGIIDDPGDSASWLFYSNYPMPFQNGMTIELTTRGAGLKIPAKYSLASTTSPSQLKVMYDYYKDNSMLTSLGLDYVAQIPGNGKLVGAVLVTRDSVYDAKTIPTPPANLVPGTTIWPMAYIEGNVTIRDGSGNLRVYSGLEDFADAGYNFDSDQGQGAKNRSFAGVLGFVFNPPEKGYVTIFRYFNDSSAFLFKRGLTIAIQHGTWKNNFPVRYGLTAFYYSQVP